MGIVLSPGDLNMDALLATYPESYSVDSADVNYGPLYSNVEEPALGGCREHFKPISLWWNSPHGIVAFDLHPPLLFVKYSGGSSFGAAKVVFETTEPDVDGTDPLGYVYRFGGRFNALCKNTDQVIGPVVFQGQVLVAVSPIDAPRLVSSPPSGGGGACIPTDEEIIFDPISEEQAPDCPTHGSGGGGTSSSTCDDVWIVVEIDYGDGIWHTYWEGYVKVCV